MISAAAVGNHNYYGLDINVYVVKGAKNHCIYDLRNGELYSINQATLDLISLLRTQKGAYSSLLNDEREAVDQLLQMNILIPSSYKTELVDIISLKEKPSPLFSWIEVTRKCNLSCTFCYEGSDPYCTERMSLKDFYHVCHELKDIGVKRIQFIGGEPMILKEDLKLMIKHCRNDFDFIEVYSNGVLITDDWAKFFKEYNIAVALSIHSYLPEEHDYLTTVKGSHRKVLRGLDFLKKHGVKYRIGTVRSTACSIGTKLDNTGYTLKPKEPKVVGRADLSSYSLEMFKRKAITKERKRFPINKDMITTAVSGHQCFIKDLYISSLLDVYPCVMERRLSHGNLRNKKLSDILDDKIRYLSKDHIEGCKECEYRYSCFDCRPDSNGRGAYQKPWYCTYNPKNGEWYDVEEAFNHLMDNAKSKSKIASIPVVVEHTS